MITEGTLIEFTLNVNSLHQPVFLHQIRPEANTPNELKTWYDSMHTKLIKLKKAVTKSRHAADRFTASER